MSQYFADFFIILLIIFTAPIPWSLTLFHFGSKKRADPKVKLLLGLSLIFFWILLSFLVFLNKEYIWQMVFSKTIDFDPFYRFSGIIVLITAMVIDISVIKSLGLKKLLMVSELMEEKDPHVLVTTGIYSFARHPRYVEYPFWFLGLGLVTGYVFLFWFSFYLFAALAVASVFEEQELMERFGEAYLKYRKNTPRFF